MCDLLEFFRLTCEDDSVLEKGWEQILRCLNDLSISQSCPVATLGLEPWLAGKSPLSLPGPCKRKPLTLGIVLLLLSWRMVGKDTNFLCEQGVSWEILRKLLHLILISVFTHLLLSIFFFLNCTDNEIKRKCDNTVYPRSHSCEGAKWDLNKGTLWLWGLKYFPLYSL